MLSSVSDMKNFVANDLKGLKQQHKSLTVRKYICCMSVMNQLISEIEVSHILTIIRHF